MRTLITAELLECIYFVTSSEFDLFPYWSDSMKQSSCDAVISTLWLRGQLVQIMKARTSPCRLSRTHIRCSPCSLQLCLSITLSDTVQKWFLVDEAVATE